MERDFMGLGSQEPLVVKEETSTNDVCKDTGSHWPYLNKVSAIPPLMSFKAAHEEKTKKVVPDWHASSSGFIPTINADPCDPSKRTVTEVQKTFNLYGQGSPHLSLTSAPLQHNIYYLNQPHEARMVPFSNHVISVPPADPPFKTNMVSSAQNLPGNMRAQPFPAGVCLTNPNADLPVVCSTGRNAEAWTGVKLNGPPSQLTIFFGGMVNVYDNITPEKAQAIMFLAGSGCPVALNTVDGKLNDQESVPKQVAGDYVVLNQAQPNSQSCARLSSPLSVSSHPVSPSQSKSISVTSPVGRVDMPTIADGTNSVPATTFVPAAIPQARKASLARFLEKRKERVISAMPYSFSKKCPDFVSGDSSTLSLSSASATDKDYR